MEQEIFQEINKIIIKENQSVTSQYLINKFKMSSSEIKGLFYKYYKQNFNQVNALFIVLQVGTISNSLNVHIVTSQELSNLIGNTTTKKQIIDASIYALSKKEIEFDVATVFNLNQQQNEDITNLNIGLRKLNITSQPKQQSNQPEQASQKLKPKIEAKKETQLSDKKRIGTENAKETKPKQISQSNKSQQINNFFQPISQKSKQTSQQTQQSQKSQLDVKLEMVDNEEKSQKRNRQQYENEQKEILKQKKALEEKTIQKDLKYDEDGECLFGDYDALEYNQDKEIDEAKLKKQKKVKKEKNPKNNIKKNLKNEMILEEEVPDYFSKPQVQKVMRTKKVKKQNTYVDSDGYEVTEDIIEEVQYEEEVIRKPTLKMAQKSASKTGKSITKNQPNITSFFKIKN